MSKAPFTVAFCPVRNRASPARSAIPDRQHCASPEASPEKCPVISAEPPDSCKSWSLPKACFRTASRISSSFPGTLLNEICLTEYDVDLGDVTFAAEMVTKPLPDEPFSEHLGWAIFLLKSFLLTSWHFCKPTPSTPVTSSKAAQKAPVRPKDDNDSDNEEDQLRR
ncbi:hypothetical protein MGG_17229 [Pyricularia oryzae 70-15]|uniref:Uncharacterized protein n=1 Tax=Pyricularia oryzae (strain 70-15 / ATCC MYA-4617 / FGSC 8958) TaxID=242507 RepID=G4N907_PYRO7|nr:uncharacterized protein MGG_17229 [Pyricularia oryzae 70-15]EHA51102.1 hypothetical protein MGG_17229 [Pyricularia oryzae 70-15]